MQHVSRKQNGSDEQVRERERLLIREGYIKVFHDDPHSLQPRQYLIRLESLETKDAFETKTANVIHWLEGQ